MKYKRTRRALLAAVVAAAVVPGAAEAATVEVFDSESFAPHAFAYEAAPGEQNNVRVRELADGSTVISDSRPLRLVGDSTLDGCRLLADGDVICAHNAKPVRIELGDNNDTLRYEASEPFGDRRFLDPIDMGDGNDTFFAGLRRNAQGTLRVNGGPGIADTVSYAESPSPVNVFLDGIGNDGHGADFNNINPDFENIVGTPFADNLTGSDLNRRERITGGLGDDRLTGLGGDDVFHEGNAPSGADTIVGGAGIDLVDYSLRRNRVDVRMDDVVRNDGEAGERDFIDPNTNDAFGGSAGDNLVGGAGANVFIGNGGGDALIGNAGNDRVNGGGGEDFLSGGANDDTVEAADNEEDTIRCGTESDTLFADLQDDDATACEKVTVVGVLSMAPKAIVAEAGKVAHVKLAWTHPESWKELRRVTLRLRDGERAVGRVVVKPHADKLLDGGAVELVQRRSELRLKGRAARADLALRLDEKLAGLTLDAEVLATDRKGRTQVERNAATVSVAG